MPICRNLHSPIGERETYYMYYNELMLQCFGTQYPPEMNNIRNAQNHSRVTQSKHVHVKLITGIQQAFFPYSVHDIQSSADRISKPAFIHIPCGRVAAYASLVMWAEKSSSLK